MVNPWYNADMMNLDRDIENLLPMMPPVTRPRLHCLQAVATAGLCRWRWSEAKRRDFVATGLIRRVPNTCQYEITARGCRLLSYGELWYGSNS